LPRAEWKRKYPDEKTWEGPRIATYEDLKAVDYELMILIGELVDCIERMEEVVFFYGNSDRVVAPFVIGLSSDGNPLMRGYQLEGTSRSGKGSGWRVYQIKLIENLEHNGMFFVPENFGFVAEYPWIYKVIGMIKLEEG